ESGQDHRDHVGGTAASLHHLPTQIQPYSQPAQEKWCREPVGFCCRRPIIPLDACPRWTQHFHLLLRPQSPIVFFLVGSRLECGERRASIHCTLGKHPKDAVSRWELNPSGRRFHSCHLLRSKLSL